MRADWQVGCPVSLSGLHYERHKMTEGEKSVMGYDQTAVCRPCGKAAPSDHREDILTFLEIAEQELREGAERRKKLQASYIRAGNRA